MQSDSDIAMIDASCVEHCPARIRAALRLVGGKWSAPLLITLLHSDAPLRYAELQRRLAPVTPKELARHLRALEGAGVVRRIVYPTVPPSVEYTLTPFGRTLHPALEALAAWGERLDASPAG